MAHASVLTPEPVTETALEAALDLPRVPITVTGSTGTIGTELVRLLSNAGTLTRALYRDIRKTRVAANVTWVKADLSAGPHPALDRRFRERLRGALPGLAP